MTTNTICITLGLTLISCLFLSCTLKNSSSTATVNSEVFSSPNSSTAHQSAEQIAEYIRNIYEDKNGHLWMGTNGYGVAHYNGDSIAFYSNHNGFDGQQVTGVTEDREGNLWFATDQGVVQYKWEINSSGQKKFINYSSPLLFYGQRFWSIMADSKNNIWAGAERVVYKFDGKYWLPVEVPYPEEVSGSFNTPNTAWSIIEDREGNIWISTNGYGAYKYDGSHFTLYSEKEGLANNNVDIILEDKRGNMWFGTRFGGVSRYDGITSQHFTTLNGRILNDEVCAIHEDSDGYIWFSAEGYGVYRFDGEDLINYSTDQGLGVRAVQTILEDSKGRLWVGGGGGLYLKQGERFVNVTKQGLLNY